LFVFHAGLSFEKSSTPEGVGKRAWHQPRHRKLPADTQKKMLTGKRVVMFPGNLVL